MTTVFHDIMHVTMEDYVDNPLGKLITREEHLNVLATVFDHLEKFKVKLNPKKHVFGVTLGKLLGYIVSLRIVKVQI